MKFSQHEIETLIDALAVAISESQFEGRAALSSDQEALYQRFLNKFHTEG